MPPSSWGITAPPWVSDAGSEGIGLGNIGPRQVTSAVVAGMQQVTSSVRFLLIGCFQCSSSVRGNGCWSRRREETDRTWFDCDQLQGDAPFCYENPVALDSQDATPTTTSGPSPQHQGGRTYNSIPPKPPTQKRRKFTAPNGNIPLHLPIVKRIQSKREKIKQYSRAPKMTLSPIMNKSPKLSRRSATNGNIIQSPLQSLETPVRVEPERKDNNVLSKENKPDKEKDSQVVSFAAQLEQSLRKLEQEIQRSGGEYLRSDSNPQVFDTLVESPLEECSTVFREDEFPDSESQIPIVEDEITEDLNHIKRDIWKPSELEDAFECYNMAAFQSFGHYKGVDATGQHRNQTGKYQEVFPPNIHSLSSYNTENNIDNYNNNNNDNSIRNQNKDFKSESSCEKDGQGRVELNKESETDLDHKQIYLSKKEVIHIINICAFENDFDDACEQLIKNELICDELFLYDGRSFNIKLIFDLVKTTMCECNEIYKISMALCETYPIEIVQKRVITYLEKKIDDTTLTPSGIQAFRNAIDPSRVIDENSFKSALIAEKIIESVLFEESKEDGRIWKDVKKEEKEIKEAITNDIFNDLISDSVSVLTNIYDLKMIF